MIISYDFILNLNCNLLISMASTSTSSRPAAVRYDVFLSFRGEDARHTFTDHLYHALLQSGLDTFRDDDEIDRGQQLKLEIETAIIESRASIVVLSENYARSRWCLDELCLILKQKRKFNQFVLPVFYHVDPSDVRNQRGSFGIWTSVDNLTTAFSNCLACLGIEKSKWTEGNVRLWKAALTEVANLTGFQLSRLMMHQLLQEMGRNIICEESRDPAKRSRVWNDAESYHVLRKGDGSNTIEGLSLDMRKIEQGMRSEALALNTSSFANMDKLKLLQLKYVKLIGSYEKFPELIWLWWHGCPLQRIPIGLLMSSLVAIDMRYGHMEVFEVPMVLHSLKILNLMGCDKLVSICNLYRLPKLNILELWNCSSLTHLCKSLGDLESLSRLGLTGCTKLWKYVNQQGTMLLQQQSLISLPQSLTWLDLSNGSLEYHNDVCTVFHSQSFLELHMAANPFKYLPNNIDLKMLRILNLYSCSNLKSLPCIPIGLEELYIDWCTSLERVTFQSGRFRLRVFSYECCFKLSEIQGLFKLVPIAKINEDLGHLQWIKAYEDNKVDLVGDDITKGKIWHVQMLYEYGIMSTYLQGIKDQILTRYEYMSSSDFIVFCVPSHLEKKRIQGINVCCLYRSSGSKNKDVWNLWAKISNRTKGVTWVYNPVVYCKPKVDEDVVWLSYWPIGNILDAGDEVSVNIYVEEGMIIVGGCGASIVYIDSEVDEKKKCENNMKKEEEVIGGDLSEFEVTTGCYYLCRRDVFGLETSYWLKKLFGDNIHYPVTHRWRKTHQTVHSKELRDYSYTFHKIIEMGVSFGCESELDKVAKALSSLVGVESVSAHKEIGKLIITGYVDPVEVATCVRQFDNMVVDILSYKIIFE